jgi:sterol desaturase/sphingolipid hydroxylase (fatty acid hydroxylase superfamily)
MAALPVPMCMTNPEAPTLDKGPTSLTWSVSFSVLLVAVACATGYAIHDMSAVVSIIVALGGYILLSCAERISPTAGPGKSSRRWWMHLQLNAVNLAIGIPITAFFASYVSLAVSKYLDIDLGLIDLRLAHAQGILGLLCAGLIGTIAVDFFYYWFHRAMHRSAVLWQHHKMHHLDPEFDALTGLRFNWLEHVLFGVLVLVPSTIFLKIRSVSFVDYGIGNSIVLFILMMLKHMNHSNLRIQFGRASFLWMSSQTHRIHHSRLPEHQDKNFAAFFPLWDILFGTYHAPRWNEFPPTGVEGENEIRSLWEAQIYTFREWWRMLRAWRGRRKDRGLAHTFDR